LVGSTPRFTLEGQPVASGALLAHLAGELEAASRLLSEEEARVFHDELVQDLADELHKRIDESRRWVRAVRDTLAGLNFHGERLDLELERRVSGGLAEIVDGGQAPEFWPEARLESVRREVRETVRRLRENPDPEKSFHQALEAALDYREWYGFRFFSVQFERRSEISDRRFQSRSGGERSAVLYTFLFAALGARFDAMRDGPRLIGLDEAFAGMDAANIAALYSVLDTLDLSLIATSPSDIYLSRSLPAASAYRLFRVTVKNADGDGYSGGSCVVGLDHCSELAAARSKASMPDGCLMVMSVMRPSLWTLKEITTWPFITMAASGMSQLRLIWATNRRIHGPNSTPLVSNWM